MSHSSSGLQAAFKHSRIREVAAVMTIRRLVPPKQIMERPSILDQMLSLSKAGSLIVRRPWFGFDRVLLDDDLVAKIRQRFAVEQNVSPLYEILGVNPTAAVLRKLGGAQE